MFEESRTKSAESDPREEFRRAMQESLERHE